MASKSIRPRSGTTGLAGEKGAAIPANWQYADSAGNHWYLWFDTNGLLRTAEASVFEAAGFNYNTGGFPVGQANGNMSAGAGVSAAETYNANVVKNGNLITTRIIVDMTGLVGSATDLDIIGNTGGAASANFGRFTTAINGTLVGGRVTCLEVPAGGTADIDFYSSDVATGAQDVIITDAALGTETALVTSGGAWTSGLTKGMTALPTANDYLYIVNGAAAGGTFSAGKFLIELFGIAA